MRILFVGINARYINPTNSLIPLVLKGVGDTRFFGPGFVDDDLLKRGVSAFYESNGPFDVVATTTQLAVINNPDAAFEFYKRYSLWNGSQYPFAPFMADVRTFLCRVNTPRICFVMDLDFYAVRSDLLEQLSEASSHFVAWGEGFSKRSEELPLLDLESEVRRKRATRPIGRWHTFASANRHRVINLGHFVGLHEFHFRPLSLRTYSASVAGQLYYARKKALKELKASRLLRVATTRHRTVYSALCKLGLSPHSWHYAFLLYNSLFVRVLTDTKVSMTDGGGYEMVIRKFFEIPAAGSLLLARPCAGFEALGFKNEETAVVLDEQDPVSQVLGLLRDPERLQQIATAGQEMVWKKHSVPARVEQLKASLELILANQFVGSYWQNGEFGFLDT